MRYKSIFWFILLLVSACKIQNESSPGSQNSPTPSPVVLSNLPEPSLTPIQTPTVTIEPLPTETSTPLPTASPTNTPSPTPLPKPFELSISLSAVPYSLPFAVVGDIAYIVDDNRFTIWKISEVINPQEIWHSESLGDLTEGVAVIENHAFLIVDNTLLVWVVEDLQNPTIIATLPIPNGRPLFDFKENLLYLIAIAPENSRITTIDLSDPNTPVELGTANLDQQVAISASTAIQKNVFLADGEVIKIFDISSPIVAIWVGQISDLSNIISGPIIAGNLLFITTEAGTFIYDITDIESPRQLGIYSAFPINHLNIVGNIGFLFSEICGFEVADDGEVTGGCGMVVEVVNFSTPAEPDQEGILRIGYEDCFCDTESVTMLGYLMFFEAGGNLYVLDTKEFVQ